jgi:hypothetical protein
MAILVRYTKDEDILPATEAANKINRMKPGEQLVYFEGDLSRERGVTKYFAGVGIRRTPRAARINTLGDFMLRQGSDEDFSFGDGVVVRGHNKGRLLRRRVADGRYQYLFVKK